MTQKFDGLADDYNSYRPRYPESLLEEMSPGYSRYYRSFDVAAELRDVLTHVDLHRVSWPRWVPITDFLKMGHGPRPRFSG